MNFDFLDKVAKGKKLALSKFEEIFTEFENFIFSFIIDLHAHWSS